MISASIGVGRDGGIADAGLGCAANQAGNSASRCEDGLDVALTPGVVFKGGSKLFKMDDGILGTPGLMPGEGKVGPPTAKLLGGSTTTVGDLSVVDGRLSHQGLGGVKVLIVGLLGCARWNGSEMDASDGDCDQLMSSVYLTRLRHQHQ